MTVVAYQHARLAENHKSAVEWLESHTKAMMEIREAQRAADAEANSRAKDIDSRIEKLVSAIGELLRARGPIDGQQTQ